MAEQLVVQFDAVGTDDIALVGGKIASLGEMLQEVDVPVPPGFAVTTDAYFRFLHHNALEDVIHSHVSRMDIDDVASLQEAGKAIRTAIMEGAVPEEIQEAISEQFHQLHAQKDSVAVAVRSSATAEDIETASFAGQQETYLNVQSEAELMEKIKACFASLFTDRAIHYREERGFAHLEVGLAVAVQMMVDAECAGVAFTLDPDSGFEEVVTINGNWGLGTSVVSGLVNTDKFFFFKPTGAVVSREKGEKELKLVDQEREKQTTEQERAQFVLKNAEVEELGSYCIAIEEYYGRFMDIEWAKDADTGKLYIVQARPETVHSQKDRSVVRQFILEEESEIVLTGHAIGRKIGQGTVNVLTSPDDIDAFSEGQVLVTDMTDPDWEPIMKQAAAIITNKGGSTSHAAIVSRELGIPAVIGTGSATNSLQTGETVTVDCTSETGKVWEGELSYEVRETAIDDIPKTETEIMLNVGLPEDAFDIGQYPVDGVGLAREEFIINSHIGEHPLHMLEEGRGPVFVEQLAHGIGKIGSAFYPRPVIVRLSDFKSNEYAELEGGAAYEPEEHNPLTGWRGAARYIDSEFREAFRLECQALRQVREEMGLTNVIVMVPFCRTLEEAEQVLDLMAEFGLEQGKNGLEVYVMAEIPSNVLLADKFAKLFNGFSIGTNDLTALTLGIDRDSEKLAWEFDERDDAAQKMVKQLIEQAHATRKDGKQRKSWRKVGICGDAPSTHPDYAAFLVEQGIDSISVTPDVALETKMKVAELEQERGKQRKRDVKRK